MSENWLFISGLTSHPEGMLISPGDHVPWRRKGANHGAGHTWLKTYLHIFLL